MYTDDDMVYDGLTSDEGNDMILTIDLRTSALTAIAETIKDFMIDAPGVVEWKSIKAYADDAERISAAVLDEEVDHIVEMAINEWADAEVIKEARLAEMDQMLEIAVDDFTGDNPEISVDAAWYDLVQSVVINYERDAITAAWIRTKL